MKPDEIVSQSASIVAKYSAFENSVTQPLVQTAAMVSKLNSFQNTVNPASFRFLNEAVKAKTIWTESFINQMTRFQKTASVLDNRADLSGGTFIGNLLRAERSWNRLMMGYATTESLDNLFSYNYELIASPGIEVPETKIIFLDEVSRIKDAIREIYRDNKIIYQLEPRAFEEMVAELLRKQNFNVELTKQTRDGGYDLIALQNISGFPYRFLVECKRHASHRPVGVNIVRSFCQVMSEEKNNGIIVTSSYFSPEAKAYKAKFEPYNLHLRDYDDVLKWVNQYVTPIL